MQHITGPPLGVLSVVPLGHGSKLRAVAGGDRVCVSRGAGGAQACADVGDAEVRVSLLPRKGEDDDDFFLYKK